MLAMHGMIDDSLLKSRGVTVNIGYAARETKPDWPLVRHKMLHVIIEYPVHFFPQKKSVENPQLATPKWFNQKYGKPLNNLISSERCPYAMLPGA